MFQDPSRIKEGMNLEEAKEGKVSWTNEKTCCVDVFYTQKTAGYFFNPKHGFLDFFFVGVVQFFRFILVQTLTEIQDNPIYFCWFHESEQ